MVKLTRWVPSRLGDLRTEMDRLFEDFLGGDGFEPFALSRRMSDLSMPLDVIEEKDKLVVKTELPGLKQKDIQVDLQDDVLTIKGEKKNEVEEKDKHFHRVERTYGSFSRSLALPSYVDAGKVDARYDQGVLTITLNKKEEAKPKKIDIEVK